MPQAARIFVSHSHQDDSWCRAFVTSLQRIGADAWYFPTADVGNLFLSDVESELRSRPIFIVILSPASVRSPWVKREVNAAINLQDRQPERIILPIVAERTEIPPLWAVYKRISGPQDTGISPDEAATRVANALAITPEAITNLRQSESAGGAEEMVERGMAFRARGLHHDALLAFDKAIMLDETNGAAWTGKAYALQALGRNEEALHAFEQALARDKFDGAAWTGKAYALQALGRNEEALHAFEQAANASPSLFAALSGKASLLERLERPDEAREAYTKREAVTFDRALALNFRPALVWNGTGNALRALKRFDEALNAYDRALSLEPSLVSAWIGKSAVLRRMDRVGEALIANERALALDPHDPAALEARETLRQNVRADNRASPLASHS